MKIWIFSKFERGDLCGTCFDKVAGPIPKLDVGKRNDIKSRIFSILYHLKSQFKLSKQNKTRSKQNWIIISTCFLRNLRKWCTRKWGYRGQKLKKVQNQNNPTVPRSFINVTNPTVKNVEFRCLDVESAKVTRVHAFFL